MKNKILIGRTERIKNLESCSDRPTPLDLSYLTIQSTFNPIPAIISPIPRPLCCKRYNTTPSTMSIDGGFFAIICANVCNIEFTSIIRTFLFSEKYGKQLGAVDDIQRHPKIELKLKYPRNQLFFSVFGSNRCCGVWRKSASIFHIFLIFFSLSPFHPMDFTIYKTLTTTEYTSVFQEVF
jgi:hypothetical protein